MKTQIFLVSMLLLSVIVSAQEFKSLAAKDALAKYQSGIKKLEEQYKKDLEAALISATKSGNLDEAILIKATIEGKVEDKEIIEKPVKEKPKAVVARLPPGVFAILYDRENYEGKSQEIKTIGRLGSPTIGGDAVRSLKVAPGYRVDLYVDSSNCTGSFTSFTENNTSVIPNANSVEVAKVTK